MPENTPENLFAFGEGISGLRSPGGAGLPSYIAGGTPASSAENERLCAARMASRHECETRVRQRLRRGGPPSPCLHTRREETESPRGLEWSLRVRADVRRPGLRGADARRIGRAFGLPAARTETLWKDFSMRVEPGRIVVIHGPSGCGKSVLLRRVAAHAGRRAVAPDPREPATWCRPAIEAVGPDVPLEERLEALSRCGLADASVLVTPARHLSAGQQFRLGMARAALAAGRRGDRMTTLLIADEFGSNLDYATAWALCRRLRPLAESCRFAVLVATPRRELVAAIGADRVVHKPLVGPAVEWPAPPALAAACPLALRIESGRIDDYRALSAFHYVAGPPAAHKRVWVVRTRPEGGIPSEPAAVLVVSPPLRRCRGRNAALPRRYTTGRQRGLRRLNRDIEAVSRVVVHPSFRGLGLGAALVRHALATAGTPMVEALATMGAIHPIFERAGMVRYGTFDGRKRYVYYLGSRSPYIVAREDACENSILQRTPSRRTGRGYGPTASPTVPPTELSIR